MSSAVLWQIIRNNSAYLLKKPHTKKAFSTEPGNLKNLNSFWYNGLIHKRVLAVEPAADKKGFVVIHKRAKGQRHPAKSRVRITMKAGPRRSLFKLRRFVLGSGYNRAVARTALRRASAILKSQKPIPVKKGRPKKAE